MSSIIQPSIQSSTPRLERGLHCFCIIADLEQCWTFRSSKASRWLFLQGHAEEAVLELDTLGSLANIGLTPDDRVLTTRDTGVEEIYAFDLEYK